MDDIALPNEKPIPAYSEADFALADRLLEENYDRLMDIARSKRRRANVGETLRTIDLLHECWLKLDGKTEWRGEEHFIRAATLAMRHVIIDYVRRKQADKRGGSAATEPLEEQWMLPEFSESPEQLLQIGDMMTRLESVNPRWMRVVDARYFAGMTEEEAAASLSVSARTVRREWQSAREWIGKQMGVVA